MAALDDLRTAIIGLDDSVDTIITKLQDLKIQLGNSVLAADIEAEIQKLLVIKNKLDAAVQ